MFSYSLDLVCRFGIEISLYEAEPIINIERETEAICPILSVSISWLWFVLVMILVIRDERIVRYVRFVCVLLYARVLHTSLSHTRTAEV